MSVRLSMNAAGFVGSALIVTASFGPLAMRPAWAQAIVQALPDPAAAELSEAMQRLSRDPYSLMALLDAGRASLRLNNVDAAEGFFERAQALAPADGRVLAGLGGVALARRDAPGALRLFDRAQQTGEGMAPYAAQRGLAYDLVGMNALAQRLYGEALAQARDEEILRRLALSYAIAGDAAASEATLLPLLQAQDLAAFRTRAFALAINGKPDEAVSIAETRLPARIARRLAPYLQYMPRLTRAQQAAAANFGAFPPTAEIGRDPPEIAVFAGGTPAAIPPQPDADSRLIPGGAPLGPTGTVLAAVENPPVAELPPLDANNAPVAEPAPSLATSAPVAVASNQDELAPVSDPEPAPVAIAAVDPFAARRDAAMVSPPPAAVVPEQAPLGLEAAFADFEMPASPVRGPVSPDAVDITRIVPARDLPPEPEPEPEPEPPPRQLTINPSRHWVQLATGQDVSKFRWDWQRKVREAGGLLDGRDAFFAAWGANNRLVTGPFPTEAEAQEFVTRLKVGGVDSFIFASGNGERVMPIP